MSENLKTLLQQALDMLEEQALHIEAPMLPAGEELLKRIRAAISQQVEPAPAQDEHPASGVTIEKDIFGTVHIKLGDVDYIQIQYQYPYTDNASQNVLAKRIVELLTRPAQTEQQPAYVECRECTDCGHVGINDAHQTDATCAMCDWSGPSPVEDQCPGCGKENAMGAACPKCSGRYRILAETHVAAPIAQTEQQPHAGGLLNDALMAARPLLEKRT